MTLDELIKAVKESDPLWALQHQGAQLWTSQGRQTLRRTPATAPDEQQASFVASSAKRHHEASPHLTFHLQPSASTARERYLRGTVKELPSALTTAAVRSGYVRVRQHSSARHPVGTSPAI